MPVTLYLMDASAPCRSVWMAAKALNIDVNLHRVDLQKGEHKADWFVKLNPQHCVPTIDDGGFVLWESRAILPYLADAYGKDDSLYPKDLKKRAVVNRLLNWDMGAIYKNIGGWIYPQMFKKEAPCAEKEKEMKDILCCVDKALEGKKFFTGDHVTIADLSILSSITFLEPLNYNLSHWSNITAWLQRCKQLPYYHECNHGLEMMKAFLQKSQ